MMKYQKIGNELAALIGKKILRRGDRVPSVRSAARKYGVNLGTVTRAYRDLEARGLIESLPRSGYFVRAHSEKSLDEPTGFKVSRRSSLVKVSDLIFDIFQSMKKPGVIQFGSSFVNPELFPAAMARAGAAAARGLKPALTIEDLPPGNRELRRLIALRYLETGHIVAPEEIVITSGALEAIFLCLRAATRPGDTVAIETPTFCNTLQMLELMGRRVTEIATDPREGIDLKALEQAFETGSIKACVVIPTFQNPLGSCMPEENKRRLARLAERHKIPVIEDAAYAELYFGTRRPPSVKSFDRAGWVLHCGSFSKCLAPGYRIGWAAPGRYMRDVWENKVMSSLTTAPVCQEALVRYLKRGGFEQHLRRLRQTLFERCQEMLRALSSDLPASCRVTRPEGGYMLWVELPKSIDALGLYQLALEEGVSIRPGPLFSAQGNYRNCMRLNFGFNSVAQIRRGVSTLARLIHGPATSTQHRARILNHKSRPPPRIRK
jgi:DNA-binding transcriptional MocR family regulator